MAMGDHVVVTTVDARLDGNPASNFVLEHSLYHAGGGEMPRTFDEELVGMVPGETKDAEAKIKLPLAKDGDASPPYHAGDGGEDPELPHAGAYRRVRGRALRARHDGGRVPRGRGQAVRPARHGQERRPVPRPRADELAKRLVEDPDPADLLPGQPLDARASRAPSTRSPTTWTSSSPTPTSRAQMPGNDAEQREKIRQQLEDQGWATRPGCSRAARPRSRGW